MAKRTTTKDDAPAPESAEVKRLRAETADDVAA